MTKTEIAFRAIKGTELTRHTHIDIMETMRMLKLSTDEAVELRRMVGRAWSDVFLAGSDLAEVLAIAKDVTNSYARNPMMR